MGWPHFSLLSGILAVMLALVALVFFIASPSDDRCAVTRPARS